VFRNELSVTPIGGEKPSVSGQLIGWLVERNFFEQVVLAADPLAAEADPEPSSDFAERVQLYADRQRVQWSPVQWPDGTELILLFGPGQMESLGYQLLRLACWIFGGDKLALLEWFVRPVICLESMQLLMPLLTPSQKRGVGMEHPCIDESASV
jgi:hypothetical protein